MNVAGYALARLRMGRSALWSRGRTRGLRPAGWLTLAGPFLLSGFFYWAVGEALEVLAPLAPGPDPAAAGLALFLLAAFAAIWLSDVYYTINALLFDSDLELLLRAPLTRLQLFWLKLLESAPRSGPALIAMALPATLAFAGRYPLPAWGWLLLPLQLAALWAIPTGLGVAAALLLVRLFPGTRAREGLVLFTTVGFVLFWLANSFLMPRAISQAGVANVRAFFSPPSWVLAFSPPHAAAQAIAAAAQEDLAEALRRTGALLGAGAGSLLLAALAARGWLEEDLVRARREEHASRGRRGGRLPATAAGAMIAKDARLLLRDWTSLADVATIALLWTLLPLLFTPLRRGSPLFTARAMLVALAVALGYQIGSRAVPFERAGLAWSRLAPLTERRWNALKLAGAALASLPFVAIAVIPMLFTLRLSPGEWLAALVAGLSALALALTLGLWTGWTFGDRAWTNPRAMLTFGGRLAATALMLLQGALWLVLLTLADAARAELPPGLIWWGPPALAALVSLAAFEAAARRMRRFERF